MEAFACLKIWSNIFQNHKHSLTFAVLYADLKIVVFNPINNIY